MVGNDERNDCKSRPLAIDPDAETAVSSLPAFIARPLDAPVYHGFPIIDSIDVEGFRLGMITDFASCPDDGDAFVIAPDGSRAGLVWRVEESHMFEEVCPMEASRWGVWGVTFPEPMKTKDAMKRNLEAVLPTLKEKWLLWKEQYA
jgi:hypothetical protein